MTLERWMRLRVLLISLFTLLFSSFAFGANYAVLLGDLDHGKCFPSFSVFRDALKDRQWQTETLFGSGDGDCVSDSQPATQKNFQDKLDAIARDTSDGEVIIYVGASGLERKPGLQATHSVEVRDEKDLTQVKELDLDLIQKFIEKNKNKNKKFLIVDNTCESGTTQNMFSVPQPNVCIVTMATKDYVGADNADPRSLIDIRQNIFPIQFAKLLQTEGQVNALTHFTNSRIADKYSINFPQISDYLTPGIDIINGFLHDVDPFNAQRKPGCADCSIQGVGTPQLLSQLENSLQAAESFIRSSDPVLLQMRTQMLEQLEVVMGQYTRIEDLLTRLNPILGDPYSQRDQLLQEYKQRSHDMMLAAMKFAELERPYFNKFNEIAGTINNNKACESFDMGPSRIAFSSSSHR
jgi:vacuolar-type H+-ATPase subunit E/Vma4